MTSKRKTLGYIRISTELDGQDEAALQTQEGKIREACALHDLNLISVRREIASAAKVDSLRLRPVLRQTLADARKERALVVVVEVSRLFRNTEEATSVLKKQRLQVFSVADDRILTPTEILERVAIAADVADASRRGTSEAMLSLGAKGPSAAAQRLGNRNSVISRATKSAALARMIADIIALDPSYADLSHRGVANLLNRRGLTTSQGRSWTADNVRSAEGRAKALIAEHRDAANTPDGSVVEVDVPAGMTLPPDTQPTETIHAALPDPEDEMSSNPYFGMF